MGSRVLGGMEGDWVATMLNLSRLNHMTLLRKGIGLQPLYSKSPPFTN